MVPSPTFQTPLVNLWNLNHWEHGSWDLPLHTGPKSSVPRMTWMSTWQHSLRWGSRLVLRVGPSKKLDLTSRNTSHKIFAYNSQYMTKAHKSHTLMGSWGSKVGTLPPWWDCLTWMGLGTPCERALRQTFELSIRWEILESYPFFLHLPTIGMSIVWNKLGDVIVIANYRTINDQIWTPCNLLEVQIIKL